MHLKRAHAMSHATNILNYNFFELNHLGLVCKLFIAPDVKGFYRTINLTVVPYRYYERLSFG